MNITYTLYYVDTQRLITYNKVLTAKYDNM